MKIFKKFVLGILFLALFLGPAGAIPPNKLDENCNDISDWADLDTDTAVSEVDPAGQFRFDTNLGAAGNAVAIRERTISSPPIQFTLEIMTYFDSLGTVANGDYAVLYYATSSWYFYVNFASDGLFVFKSGGSAIEVGTNIVKYGGAAAWQTWRFQVNKTAGEATATVEVFLDNVSQGTFDCDYEMAGNDGLLFFGLYGSTTNNIVAHIDFIKIGLGLGTIGPFPINNILIF